MSGLIKDSWILIAASAFNLLQYVVLVEVYGKKSGLTLICTLVRKERVLY